MTLLRTIRRTILGNNLEERVDELPDDMDLLKRQIAQQDMQIETTKRAGIAGLIGAAGYALTQNPAFQTWAETTSNAIGNRLNDLALNAINNYHTSREVATQTYNVTKEVVATNIDKTMNYAAANPMQAAGALVTGLGIALNTGINKWYKQNDTLENATKAKWNALIGFGAAFFSPAIIGAHIVGELGYAIGDYALSGVGMQALHSSVALPSAIATDLSELAGFYEVEDEEKNTFDKTKAFFTNYMDITKHRWKKINDRHKDAFTRIKETVNATLLRPVQDIKNNRMIGYSGEPAGGYRAASPL